MVTETSNKFKVLYFAGVKDITKKEFEEMTLEEGKHLTLAELSHVLISKYGEVLKEMLAASLYAVNLEYVEKEKESSTVIPPQAEIAIIPPVSGG